MGLWQQSLEAHEKIAAGQVRIILRGFTIKVLGAR